MMSTSCRILSCMAWKEMLWSARMPPLIWPGVLLREEALGDAA
jgi:hypothetical protein